jgi:hypothetical protein
MRSRKAIDVGVNVFKKLCDGVQWMAYQKVRHKTEAFFEKGRLYQALYLGEDQRILIYTKEAIQRFMDRANENNFLRVSLEKNICVLQPDTVFLLLDIKRYRFDYIIITALIGDEVKGIVLHSAYAMYPWDVFKQLS